MPTFPNDGDSENWGYKFVRSAVDKFIRDVDGQAAYEAYPDFSDRRNRAEDLMFDLIGESTCLFYVRRKGAGRSPGEEIWDLIIATDGDDVQLPVRLKERGKTLGLLASVTRDGYGGLQILSAQLLQPARGNADGYAVPCRLRLLPNHPHRIGIPPDALLRMAAMPVCGNHVPTEDQLKAWKAFLQIEENIAKARQFCMPFLSHNYILWLRGLLKFRRH